MEATRRTLIQSALGAGAVSLLPSGLRAQPQASTGAVETSSGKVRGLREGAISVFRGIPYGADTSGARRFMAPVKLEPWSGVRDCFTFGHRAPQGSLGSGRIPAGADPAVIAAVQKFMTGQLGSGFESEDCLVLNIFTPDPSP